jgi:hypothetical protein
MALPTKREVFEIVRHVLAAHVGIEERDIRAEDRLKSFLLRTTQTEHFRAALIDEFWSRDLDIEAVSFDAFAPENTIGEVVESIRDEIIKRTDSGGPKRGGGGA